MISSVGQRGHSEKAEEAGLDGYLSKPYRQKELLECLTSVMNKKSGHIVTRFTSRTESADIFENTAMPNSDRRRILIVEDDRALARVLADNLRFAGYDVSHLDDGAEVVSKVRTFAPDLVLLDVTMPNMSGKSSRPVSDAELPRTTRR